MERITRVKSSSGPVTKTVRLPKEERGLPRGVEKLLRKAVQIKRKQASGGKRMKVT